MSNSSSPIEPIPPGLGALLRLAWRAVREQMYARIRAAGYGELQPAHIALFGYPTIDGVRPTEIADRLLITKQSVNDLLRQLEAAGYLKLRPDPADARARLVTLTRSGTKLSEAVRAASWGVEREWALRIGEERFRDFRDMLSKFAETPGEAAASAEEFPAKVRRHRR